EAWLLRDRLGNNSLVQADGVSDPEIRKTAADVLLDRTRKSLPDLDVDFRMLPAERHERRRQDVVRDRHQAGDDDLAAQLAVQVSDLLGLLQQLAQEPFRHRYELAAGRRLRHAAGPAREQLHAEE